MKTNPTTNLFDQAVTRATSCPPDGYKSQPCPDQYVGKVLAVHDHPRDFPHRELADRRPNFIGQVVLILESPHIHEFIHPCGPAKGGTGRLIRQHLGEILNGRGLESWDLYLVNAIQNQCSLGKPTSSYRDVVFSQAWSLYGEANFIARLRALVSNNAIVINACTKVSQGKSRVLRREIVEQAVYKALNRQSDIRITHPASWASPTSRCAFW